MVVVSQPQVLIILNSSKKKKNQANDQITGMIRNRLKNMDFLGASLDRNTDGIEETKLNQLSERIGTINSSQ
jgi:hypothetical protein